MSQLNGQAPSPAPPATNGHVPVGPPTDGEELRTAMKEFERGHIACSLRRHGYDKAQTARALGIGLSSLYRKLEELHIPRNPDEAGSVGAG
jgi:DNA-binding NtrC family response regulator